MSKRPNEDSALKPTAKRLRNIANANLESDDEEASTSASSLGDLPQKNLEAEVGIIESISLQNFMCHSKLAFNFGPNVNFIIGRNGSGKSAILTGLVLGLGGKANLTNRGANVKGFIKSGKQAAIIKIKLRNRGLDAYKPETYGNEITVERRLSMDGTSSYKLKGALHDHVIAAKKEELVRIIDQFNIQVGNPVSVLNQETSRNFLNSKSPHDKYVFFLRATHLEEIKINYGLASEKKRLAEATLEKKKVILPQLEKEMKDRERLYRAFQSLAEQGNKLKELRIEFAWALVKEKEVEAEKCEKNHSELEEKYVQKFTDRVEIFKKEIADCKKKKTDLGKKIKAIKMDIEQGQTFCDEAKQEAVGVRRELNAAASEQKQIESEIMMTQSQEKELNNRINELKSVDENQYANDKQQRLDKIEKLESEKAEFVAQKKTTENHLEQLINSIARYQDTLSNGVNEERAIASRIGALHNELGNLEASRTNRFKRYGRYMPDLLQAIDQAYQQGKFTQKPRGPIGAYITLKEAKWDLAVESCLAPLLFSFCCDSIQDEKELIKLFNKFIPNGRKPSIIVSKFQNEVYDVRKHAARSTEFETVLNTVDISDPVVANCVIDQRGIESIILIENNAIAREVMMRAVPQNCNEAFTLCADRIFPDPKFRYYSADKRNTHLLTASVEGRIQEIRAEINQLEQNKNEMAASLNSTKKDLADNKKQKGQTETQIAKIRQSFAKISMDINQLKNIEEPEQIDVSALEEDLIQLRQKKEELAARLETSSNATKEIQARVKETVLKYNNAVEKMDKHIKESEPLSEELGQYNEHHDLLVQKHELATSKLKELQDKLEDLKTTFEATKAEVSRLTELSLKMGPKVESSKTSTRIEREMQDLKKQLDIEKTRTGDREEITKRYLDARKKYSYIKQQIEDIGEIIEYIDSGLDMRKEAYKKFQAVIVRRIKYLFFTALLSRNYTGKMKFDHKQASLEIMVQPSENEEELHHDMRSLSGGERSFSTVCFIIALWDAIESPFRILDEYDVFMDMVNRRISMGMMLKEAEEQLHRQFIFLTPLDMPIVQSPITRICAMPDPERGDVTEELEDD